MKAAIVDTIPANARNTGSVNLGFEIVAERFSAQRYHWRDKLRGKYDIILFNIFYPAHALNVVPFLNNNGISLNPNRRKEKIIIGGQGVGMTGLLSDVANEVYHGEVDAEENKRGVYSMAVIKKGKGVIELTRGCRMRCAFCEYSHVTGWKYREKPLTVVEKQLDFLRSHGVRKVNFMSANYSGYSRLEDLIKAANVRGIQILNGDACLSDLPRLMPHAKCLPRSIKVGVESFDEQTRAAMKKPFSDSALLEHVTGFVSRANMMHFYLIYGLPNDNYSAWFSWLEKLQAIREAHTFKQPTLFGHEDTLNTKNIRFEFSITNFEPCLGTPLEDAPPVDFAEKAAFLVEWEKALTRCGFYKGHGMDYKTARGRIGRKELAYNLLMTLKRGGPELTAAIADAFPRGAGRSISDKEALRFFQSMKGE